MFKEKMGKGYVDNKMSVNAVEAYEQEEMPMSKWSKNAILNAIDNIDSEKAIWLKKLTLAELRKNFLILTCEHHTSKFYNSTPFYEVYESEVNSITLEEIDEIIKSRAPKTKRSKEEIIKEKQIKAEKQAKKAQDKLQQERIELLFIFQSKYKTVKGFKKAVEDNKVSINEIENTMNERIDEKNAQLKEVWTKQGLTEQLLKLKNREMIARFYCKR